MAALSNPYANQDLFWPKEFSQNYVKAFQGRGDVRKPFSAPDRSLVVRPLSRC